MTKFTRSLAVGASFVAAGVGSAMAAVPAEVTTAIGDIETDGMAVATAVLLAVVAIFAIKFIRKGL